jgi:hypothetical protein
MGGKGDTEKKKNGGTVRGEQRGQRGHRKDVGGGNGEGEQRLHRKEEE